MDPNRKPTWNANLARGIPSAGGYRSLLARASATLAMIGGVVAVLIALRALGIM